MIGTHPRTMGGIATVVRGYMEDGLLGRLDITYVPTHCDGPAAKKAAMALRALARATAVMIRTRPLVHVHLSSRASFWRKSLFCLVARFTGRPYVLHMHGSEFMKFFDEECGALAKAAVRNVFAHASLLIALSETWRENLLRICPGAPVEVLPNAVPIPDAGGRRVVEPREVLSLGRLGERKGTYDLVRAFAAVAPDFPTCSSCVQETARSRRFNSSPPSWASPTVSAAPAGWTLRPALRNCRAPPSSPCPPTTKDCPWPCWKPWPGDYQ